MFIHIIYKIGYKQKMSFQNEQRDVSSIYMMIRVVQKFEKFK